MSDLFSRGRHFLRSPAGLALRVVVSLALLAVVLSRLSLAEVAASLSAVEGQWVAGTFAIYAVAELISGRRWQVLLRAQQIEVRLPSLLGALLIGRFFNQFMLSTIGGDAARLWESARMSGRPLHAGVVLAADRTIGLLALLLVGASAALLGARYYAAVAGWQWLAALIGAATILGFYFLTHRRVEAWLRRWLPRPLAEGLGILAGFRAEPSALLQAFLLSVLLQLVVVARYYSVARAVGITIAPLVLAFTVPIALLVLVLPITLNGFGLREVTFISLLGIWGVSAAQSTAFVWLDVAIGIFIAAIGGIYFVLKRPGMASPQESAGR